MNPLILARHGEGLRKAILYFANPFVLWKYSLKSGDTAIGCDDGARANAALLGIVGKRLTYRDS